MKNLEAILTAIEQFAKDKNIRLLEGTLSDDDALPTLLKTVPTESEGSQDSFLYLLELAADIQSKFLIVEVGRLASENIEDALEQLDDASDDEELAHDQSEIDDLRRKLKSYRSHIGKIDWIRLRVPLPGMALSYSVEEFQEWNDLVYGIDDFLSGESKVEPEPKLTKANKKTIIEAIARNEQFAGAKTNTDIDLVITEVADELKIKIPGYEWPEIRNQAKSYFNMKVKPEQRKHLSRRAKQMRDDGLSKMEIRRELGISEGALHELLKAK